jgi:hypothetical protein
LRLHLFLFYCDDFEYCFIICLPTSHLSYFLLTCQLSRLSGHVRALPCRVQFDVSLLLYSLIFVKHDLWPGCSHEKKGRLCLASFGFSLISFVLVWTLFFTFSFFLLCLRLGQYVCTAELADDLTRLMLEQMSVCLV